MRIDVGGVQACVGIKMHEGKSEELQLKLMRMRVLVKLLHMPSLLEAPGKQPEQLPLVPTRQVSTMLLRHQHHSLWRQPTRHPQNGVSGRLHRLPRAATTDTRGGASDAAFQQLLSDAGLELPGAAVDVVHHSAHSNVAERAAQMLELLSALQLSKTELQALLTR